MNFDDISKRFKKFSRDTATEVQKMNEIRQLNAKVNAEKKKIKSMYAEIGKKLYDMYREEPLQGFEMEIRAISEEFTAIDLLKARVREVKGVTLCPCCNAEVSVTERFCSNCGSKMPEVFVIEESDPKESSESENSGDVANDADIIDGIYREAEPEVEEPEAVSAEADGVEAESSGAAEDDIAAAAEER